MTNVEFSSTPNSATAHVVAIKATNIESIVAELIAIIRAQTKVVDKDWSAATTLEETGIDSFDFVELIFAVEDKFGIDLDFNANSSKDIKTVSDVAMLVSSRIAAVS